MFSSSNFIFPYNSSDKVIRILTLNGTIFTTINVCKYQKSAIVGNILNIYLKLLVH